jgi:hypothetical protein
MLNKLYDKPGTRFCGEKQYGDRPTDQRTNGPTNQPTNQQSELQGRLLAPKKEKYIYLRFKAHRI